MWPIQATRVSRCINTCGKARSTARATVATLLALGLTVDAAGIAATRHNLSVSGPGSIKSPTETRICVFCHTPHNASPAVPLWNHDLSAVTNYQMYWSTTMQAYPSAAAAPQPSGSSKLCLSCHDGTVALGAVRSRATDIPVSGGPTMPTGSSGYLGTDLSGSHPFSFVYDDALATANNAAGNTPLRLPSALNDPDVKLDSLGRIQCVTCHDPHDDSNYASSGVRFYVKSDWSALCTTCHDF